MSPQFSRRSFVALTAAAAFAAATGCAGLAQALNQPPPGFKALFNGTDLAGWRGGDTFDHRKYLAMDPAARAKQDAEWTADMRAHWSVQNGEFVNDGHGKYATTVQDYGDFELLVDYKTVALADSGIYLRGVPQVQIWDYTEKASLTSAPTRARAGSGTIPPAPRARTPPCWPTRRLANGIPSAS